MQEGPRPGDRSSIVSKRARLASAWPRLKIMGAMTTLSALGEGMP